MYIKAGLLHSYSTALCLFDTHVNIDACSLKLVKFNKTCLSEYAKWKCLLDFLSFTDKDITIKFKL